MTRKIARADKHIDELDKLLSEDRPFKYVYERNRRSGISSTYAEENESLVSEATEIAGDAIHNLRAALDHVYWEIVSPCASNEREKKGIQFPFCQSMARLD